jgi:8-oxo-dGTP pyrophosphatase MutT (NUDIX family)
VRSSTPHAFDSGFPTSAEALLSRLGSAPDARLDPQAPPARMRSAVLIPIVPGARIDLVLIRRAERGDPWSGQIAFPGGRVEPDDADTRSAALREAHEELGIPSERVGATVPLGAFMTLTHEVVVHAFAGLVPPDIGLRPAPDEVAEVIHVPFTEAVRQWPDAGRGKTHPEFALAGHRVWGVTARILDHLLRSAASG